MDPTAVLMQIRRLTGLWEKDLLGPLDEDIEPSDYADQLSELIVMLDEWITKGGFLPAGWASRDRSQA